jgi:hypothetical protein
LEVAEKALGGEADPAAAGEADEGCSDFSALPA